MTKLISHITLPSSPLARLNGSLRNVAFNDEAVLSGGWFRDKDERVNAEETKEIQGRKASFPAFSRPPC